MKDYIIVILEIILIFIFLKINKWLNDFWDDVIEIKEDNLKGGDNNKTKNTNI